jgi:hypothetical protein
MANNIDLDLEIIEAGASYTLYMNSIVQVAIALNKHIDPATEFQMVSKYAKQLRDSLFRCKIDKDIRENIGNSDEIMRFLGSQELMLEISNLLARHHERRQELIFLLTCVLGSVIAGSTGGVSNSTLPAQNQALIIGRQLNVPESVINQCFMTQTLTPLRQHLRSTSWSEVIEAKPNIWGISFDIKKLFAIFKKKLKK